METYSVRSGRRPNALPPSEANVLNAFPHAPLRALNLVLSLNPLRSRMASSSRSLRPLCRANVACAARLA
eukprot:5647602-Lingulodinium_polyedra.AAC.1